VALGDQPYNLPDDGIKFDRLIAAVNKPAFTLHVGDIKSARIPCSNEIFNQALARLQTFEGALVYTIGDNEWTAANGKIGGPLTQRMRKKIDDGGFQTPYRLRKQMVEPVFGQIKQARGFRQFLLRSVEKVRAEWAMICTTHNLLKLFNLANAA